MIDRMPAKVATLSTAYEHPETRYQTVYKRALDVLLAIALLPILVPVIGVLYLMVRSSGGPGFFGDKRVGKGGTPFTCWKVRTMVTDADVRLQALLASDPEAREEWERDRKLREDPRITRFGHFLRRSSLDELPQIFNVLKGDMSFVGPRPVCKAELARYGARSAMYLAMRPGITGLWQVSGRNDVTYDERVALDTRYYNTVSLRADTTILLKTVQVVLKKTGC